MITKQTNPEKWESLCNAFSVNLGAVYRDKVAFIKVNKHRKECYDSFAMVFIQPVELDNGFRLIPGYLDYAVNKDGVIIVRDSLRELRVSVPKKGDFYPSVFARPSVSGKSMTVLIHRLVALAWAENDDPVNKCITNHIDGNKRNYRADNLEWVSYSDNALHAFGSGLRSDNISVKIRDRETGEIQEFPSMEQMGQALGMSRGRDPTYYEKGPPHTLVFKKYEVRTSRDPRPWYFETNTEIVPKSRYITTVTYPDGRTEIYWDNRDIIKKFKCWNVGSGIDSVIQKARELHPELRFDVVDRWKDRIIQTLHVESGQIVDESPWVRNAMRYMDCSRCKVERLLRLGEQRPLNGYAVRYKTDEPWNLLPEEYTGYRTRIRVTNVATGHVDLYESLRDLERTLNVSRYISKKYMGSGQSWNNYLFTEVN